MEASFKPEAASRRIDLKEENARKDPQMHGDESHKAGLKAFAEVAPGDPS